VCGRLTQVNQGFDRLRQYVRLPGLSKKKLSKVDTLRAAVVYIRQLQTLLAQTDSSLSHHFNEQLPPPSQPPPPPLLPHYQQHHQQQQPAADTVDVLSNPTSDLLFLSLLQTGANSPPTPSPYDVTSGLPVEPSALYSAAEVAAACGGGGGVPLTDVNDNYAAAAAAVPCPAWSHDDQRRRLDDITAWLLQ